MILAVFAAIGALALFRDTCDMLRWAYQQSQQKKEQ